MCIVLILDSSPQDLYKITLHLRGARVSRELCLVVADLSKKKSLFPPKNWGKIVLLTITISGFDKRTQNRKEVKCTPLLLGHA